MIAISKKAFKGSLCARMPRPKTESRKSARVVFTHIIDGYEVYLHSIAVKLVTVEERAQKPEHFPLDLSAEASPVTGQFIIPVSCEVIAHHLRHVKS